MRSTGAQVAPLTISVVVVEDSVLFQTVLMQLLDNSGDDTLPSFVVSVIVGRGDEARKLAPSPAPDVVLLDVNLPDCSGLELIEPLREKWPQAEFVILTFNDYPQIRAQAARAGAAGFVSKTDAYDELVPAILKTVQYS